MGVKVRKRGGKWYVVIDYHGRRKSKCVGSRAAAEEVKREIEARLSLGDLGYLGDKAPIGELSTVTLAQFGRNWIHRHAREHNKPSTEVSYLEDFERYVVPRFGDVVLSADAIRRKDIELWIGEMEAKGLNANTRRLAVGALRRVLNGAVEDTLMEANPALGLGRIPKWLRREQKGTSLTFAEVVRFLEQARSEQNPWYELFMTALHAGLRLGELQALRWSDLQLGHDADDPERYIFVQRTWDGRRTQRFLMPKGNQKRRVDLTPTLRGELVEFRDRHMLKVFSKGETSIADDLVFGNQEGRPFKRANVIKRHFEPLLERAGLRRIRFHDLRHTYGSLLLESDAPLKYVSEQMGHSSIQVTAEVYCHKLAGGNVSQVERLSLALERVAEQEKSKAEAKARAEEGERIKTSPQQSATQPQLAIDSEESEMAEVFANDWLGGRDSNPDTQIQSLQSYR